jgi:site-specific DNA-methyltransferase (adenine-specific)/site-specific DNA-methyltransferase (cytosine-N4-specific)
MNTKSYPQQQAVLPLEVVSNSQGEMVGKKRFSEISISGLVFEDLSPALQSRVESTEDLVMLLTIKSFERDGGEEAYNLKLIKTISDGKMTIERGFKLMESYRVAKKTQGQNSLTEAFDHVSHFGKGYAIYNKDSRSLQEIADKSVQSVVLSPPYGLGQRIYPTGVMIADQLGSESSSDGYVENSVTEYYAEIYRVLKDEGSLFINIADTYKGVSCLVTHKLVIAMVEAGWHLVGDWTWKKTNPKPVGKIKRLQPTTERIFHFVKDPKNYYFREFTHWKQGELFGIQRGCNDAKSGDKKDKVKWSLKKPIKRFKDFLDEQDVQGVIEGAAFNWAELRKIDPNFNHLAPFPAYLPILPILMTSKIGDTVLDIFSGTATTAEVALQLGRNAIGYDTDPVSIEFSKKRLDLVELNLPTDVEISEFENQYMAAA